MALHYEVDLAYYSGTSAFVMATPKAERTYTVSRWGDAAIMGEGEQQQLVLPLDLTLLKCGTEAACGDGKYIVRQVRAFRWLKSGSSDTAGAGVPLAADRTDFTFVGEWVLWCVSLGQPLRVWFTLPAGNCHPRQQA